MNIVMNIGAPLKMGNFIMTIRKHNTELFYSIYRPICHNTSLRELVSKYLVSKL